MNVAVILEVKRICKEYPAIKEIHNSILTLPDAKLNRLYYEFDDGHYEYQMAFLYDRRSREGSEQYDQYMTINFTNTGLFSLLAGPSSEMEGEYTPIVSTDQLDIRTVEEVQNLVQSIRRDYHK